MRSFIIFILLCSCRSLNFQPAKRKKDFKKALQSVCLYGEGKGRIDTGSQKFQFSYETVSKDNQWILLAEIPFRPDETLFIEKQGRVYKFKGTLYRQLKRSMKSSKLRDLPTKATDRFLLFMGKNIHNFTDFKSWSENKLNSYFDRWCKSTLGEKCTFDYQGLQFELGSGNLKTIQKLDQYTLEWESSEYMPSVGRYSLNSIHFLKGSKTLLRADFTIEKCQNDSTSL